MPGLAGRGKMARPGIGVVFEVVLSHGRRQWHTVGCQVEQGLETKQHMTSIVILTGAGISAESGLGTFRDEDGLWAQHAIEDVATPEGFARNPHLVHDFYNARRANAAQAKPNAAHLALTRLEAEYQGDVLVITQNVDGLHEMAGSRNVLHMHGALDGALCNACGHRWPAPQQMRPEDACPACAARTTRPDVVWFGEAPYGMDKIDPALAEADIFAAIGTSGQVFPAAAYGQHARRMGAHTVELNLEVSAASFDFAECRRGKATEIVPLWVEELLSGS
jgi:NAD-dependent deacetylase